MARKRRGSDTDDGPGGEIVPTDIQYELENRFLSYALSTIVSRALPDVRDGLKPVHRRVLFAMHQLRLGHEARYRKSATVVGDVIGKYHPHGDTAIYETMVRLAQDFSLRYPLVDGQGNFGNIDGDSAAAMRYTEARLTALAGELLTELKQETVDFTDTYDQQNKEPKLLPARFPNLLVNGSSGIAVGLATNIPPHNLNEVIDALVAMIEEPTIDLTGVMRHIKGPDFPTGAEIVATKREIREIYETGRGAVKVQAEWSREELERGKWQIVVTSIPYTVNKSKLIEKIAELIINKKMPDLVDVRDESTEEIRVVLEPRSQNVDPARLMAYLFKHTELQYSFPVNLTALTAQATPVRHNLVQMLRAFLDFRYDVVGRRLTYDLRLIKERLHILEALAKIYDDLDTAIKIIRHSKTRDEARKGLMAHFGLDEIQANAILDLRLAALVGLEINKIRQEKAEKEAEREEIQRVLGSEKLMWRLVRKELIDIKTTYGDKRRSKIVASEKVVPEYDAEEFIQHEDTHVIVSRQGWVRRMKQVSNPESLRFKEGDSLLAWLPLNTRDLVLYFTSAGKFYSSRALDLTPTTGFGEPVQAAFKFSDGERIIAVMGLLTPVEKGKESDEANLRAQRGLFDQLKDQDVGGIYGEILDGRGELLFVSEQGMGFRFPVETLGATNRNGRKLANVREDDAAYSVTLIGAKRNLFLLSSDGYGLLYDVEQVPQLSGPGLGARLVKLHDGERVLAARLLAKNDKVTLMYQAGKDDTLKFSELPKGERGQVGKKVGAPKKKIFGLARS
ncbi:MAG: DNA topoisomerase IV subunit A [Nitrospinae bacterium]|nr:DNA topoisomerase IV subunit A [Nitrospinota bacterium]